LEIKDKGFFFPDVLKDKFLFLIYKTNIFVKLLKQMLIDYFIYSLVSFFFSSLFIYVSKYKHLLLILLSLESMVLSLYILLFFYLSHYFFDYFITIIFLTISVCEGALGLSILVLIIRTHGSDFIIIFDNLW
jgi:NADH-ubiquinone oxidoreductase chain 4L